MIKMTLLMVMMLFSDDGGGDGGDNMQKFHGMSSVSFAHDRSRKTLRVVSIAADGTQTNLFGFNQE